MAVVQYAQGVEEYFGYFRHFFPADHYTFSLEKQRLGYRNAILSIPGCARPAGVSVEESAVQGPGGSIPIRVYRAAEGPGQPCVFIAHGGGFALGDLDAYDTLAAEMAAQAKATVVTSQFRLAPEHIFPAALDDLYCVFLDLVERSAHYRIDPERIAVTGDSSGGCFSGALPLLARDRGGPQFKAQVPLYGVLDLHRWLDVRDPDPADDFVAEMIYFSKTYLGTNVHDDRQYASPLLADDFSRLPAAYILSPEHDRLRVDSRLYAERLAAAGVHVELAVEPGMVHGCLRARNLSQPLRGVFDRVCDAFTRLLA